MYRVMLADDEGIVLDSLKMIIEKKFPEQCEIKTAKTGRDVIELAERFHPDIAFMDIQMPGINGIEAIREIKKSNALIEFIVLTAYDKFDYAREAVNLGVMEYMNKPFVAESIVKVLSKAMRKVDAGRKQRSDNLKIREKMETVAPIIETGFVYSLLFQEYALEDLDNYKQLLGMEAKYGCMMVLVMGDDQKGSHLTNAVGVSVRTQPNYANIREKIKETWKGSIVGATLSNRISVFLPMEKARMAYEDRIAMIDEARELARNLRKQTEVVFRIGIGSIRNMADLKMSYEEALKALENSTGSVAHADDLPVRCRYDEGYPLELERELFDALKNGKTEICARAAGKYFDWMLDNYDETNSSVRLKTLEFVLMAEHEVYLNGGMIYHFNDRADYMDIVYGAEKNSDLKNWFVEHFEQACRNMITKKVEHENRMVAQAKEYIIENYRRDLSLDEVSRRLNLSPYYFSKLFKEETGSNFVEYITTLRIKNAKKLLAQESLSMKEICVEVGYSDPNYFSRIFKKCVGISPTEYRENTRK